MTHDPRAGIGPMHHEDPDRYADEPDEPSECAICPPGQCPGPECPGWPGAPDADADELYQQYGGDLDHDCPKQEFLDDPITVAYGVGAEMIALVPCPVCDEQEAAR